MTAPAGPKARDLTVDLLVIGSGTGMAAALSAQERGLRALVIEKDELVGGSTARSGGAYWVPANPALRRDGSSDTVEAGRTYLTNLLDDDTPRERWEAFLAHGPEAIAMLERTTELEFFWAKGYSDYHPETPGGAAEGRTCESKPWDAKALGDDRDRLRPGPMEAPIPMPVTGADYKWMNLMARKPLTAMPKILRRAAEGIGGMVVGREYVAGGQAIAGGMFHGLTQAGVEVWTRTGVRELTTDGDRVTGAVVEQDGALFTVTAEAGVVIAAGGFDHDLERRQQVQDPKLEADSSLGTPGNTGDLIAHAQQLGAELAFMDQAWWFPSFEPVEAGAYPTIMLAERNLPGSLIVDETGKRFINEATDYMTFGQEVLRRRKFGHPTEQMWLVMDQQYRNSYVLGGQLFPRMPFPKEWYEAGIVVSADTPRELAQQMGVPMDTLHDEMLRYNELAKSGKDTEFGRGDSAYDRYYGDPTVAPNPCLRPLHGKLHAVKMMLSDLGTCGGIVADDHGRVTRADGTAIEGLWAMGNAAANVFGRHYPGAGATIAQGIVFGHIIADDAAEQLNR